MNKKKIIAIVGMTGSGKSEAVELLKSHGYSAIRFGSAIDDQISAAGLAWSPENTAYFRKKIRDDFGMAGVAITMLPKIEKELETTEHLLLDGVYSWEEYTYLKEKFPSLLLLCIYTRTDIRYERLSQRKERPFTLSEARERDISEIEVTNKGGPIALADYLIKNENSKEELARELERFLVWVSKE